MSVIRGASPAQRDRLSATVAKSEAGFSFIELVAVVAAISILAAFSVPHLSKVKMVTQENTAAASLRALYSGEVLYHSRFGTYGTLPAMVNLQYVDDSYVTGVKNGYSFAVQNPNQHSFEILALPLQAGVTGNWGFFVDETGVIRYTEDGSPPNSNSPPWD